MKFLRKIWDSLHSKPSEYIANEDMQYAGSPHAVQLPESQKDGEKLTSREIDRLRSQLPNRIICPDCMMDSLVVGPSGGGSTNIYCNNSNCLSRFNDTGPFGWQRISDRMPAVKIAAMAKEIAAENKIKLASQDDDSFELKGNL